MDSRDLSWDTSFVQQVDGTVREAPPPSNRRDEKMKRELWDQGLIYLIGGLLVFLAVPLLYVGS